MTLRLFPFRHGITNFLPNPFQSLPLQQHCSTSASGFRGFCNSDGPGYIGIIDRATIS
jgi:hypothetical protein